jgi:hypothetical protein
MAVITISAGAAEIAAEHGLGQLLDLEWVLAQDVARGHFVQIGLHGLGPVERASLADADQTFIGLHF